MNKRLLGALGGIVLIIAAVQLRPRDATASDYADGPAATADPAGDIADFYAWHTDHGTIVAILTFAANRAPGVAPVYDSNRLYSIHIDNTADPSLTPNFNDNIADIQIHVRFGQNAMGDWGVQLHGVPGAEDPTFAGPVQTVLNNGTATATAGEFDDPFFFDRDGYFETLTRMLDDDDPIDWGFSSLTTGTPVDFFEGKNAMAIIVEFDAAAAVNANPDDFIQMWATTGATP